MKWMLGTQGVGRVLAAAVWLAACAGTPTHQESADDAAIDDGGGDGGGDGSQDVTTDVTGDTATDGGGDVTAAASLVIESPKQNAVLSASGPFTVKAHVDHPPATGGPFLVRVTDPVSGTQVASATVDTLATPLQVDVNIAGLPAGGYALRVTILDANQKEVAVADLLFTANAPPSAPAVAIEPAKPTAADGFKVLLSTPSVDPEGDAVTYAYAWTRNGVAQANTADAVPAADTKKGEVWVVTVSPADPYGKGAPAFAQVLVGNQAPIPAKLAADVTVVDIAGEASVSVATSALDPDGDLLKLTWKWSVNGNPVTGKNTPKVAIAVLGKAVGQALVPGDTVSVLQVAQDGLATVESLPVTWTVGNVAPHLFLDAPAPDSTQSSAAGFSLSGHVENPPTSGGPFTVALADPVSGFVVAKSNVDDLTVPFTTTVDIAGLPAGTYAVLVTVTDASGAFVASANLVFHVNLPPAQPVVLVVPATPTAADSFSASLQTASSDPEGDLVTYAYSWTRDGKPTGETGATVPAGVAKKNEVWVVTVTPADPYGKGWAGGAYVVIGNQAPVPAQLASAATVIDVEGAFAADLAQAATDPDGDALLLTWHWTLNGVTVPGLDAPNVTIQQLAAAAEKPLVAGDIVTLTQTAFDAQAESTSAPLTWTVGNFQPHLFIDAPAHGATLTSAGPFTLYAHVENPPDLGGPFQLVVADAVSGAVVTQASIESLAGALAIAVDIGGVPDGTYALTVSVRNVADAVVAARDFTFATNTPPGQAVLLLTPATPTAADALSVQIATPAVDPEQDGLTYSYAWLRNGEATTQSTATVLPGVAKKGEVWTAVVTASDAYGAGWPATADLLIGNQVPLPAVLTADTSPVGLLGEVSVSVGQEAADPDGDPVVTSWHWAVNGVAVPAKTSAATTLLSLRNALGQTIHAGDVITVQQEVTDGEASALSNELTWTATGGDDVCAARQPCGIDAECSNNDTLDPACTCDTKTIGDGQYCILVTGLSPTASTFVVSDGTVNFTVGGNANVPGNVVVDVIDPAGGTTLSTTTIPGLGGATAIKAVSPANPSGKVTVSIQRNGVKLGEKTYDIARNTKSTAPQGSLTPANPDVTKGVTYQQSAASTDVDAGQTITYKYAWSINGTANAALTTSSVPAGTAKKGDKLTLKVTPNDGVENGAALTLNVTLVNAPPSAFTPAYVTTSVALGGKVVVDLGSAPTTDPDGDAVTYGYSWYVNDVGVPAVTGATFDTATVSVPNHTLVAGDAIRVDVLASDGTATTTVPLTAVTLTLAP